MSDMSLCTETTNKIEGLIKGLNETCVKTIVDDLFKYPLLELATKSSNEITPNHSVERNIHFVIGHCGFFFFNFINCMIIILVHCLVFEQHKKNPLLIYAFGACFWQMISCAFSIARYNINDEYGYNKGTSLAHWSNITGVIAYMFFNHVVARVFVNYNNKENKQRVQRLTIAWVIYGVFTFVYGYVKWEVDEFKHIRLLFSLSTAFQMVAYIKAFYAFSKGKTHLPLRFRMEDNHVKRLFILCIVSDIVALGLASSGNIVLQYPATGLTFSVMMVWVTITGHMDWVVRATSVGGTRITNEDIEPESYPNNQNSTWSMNEGPVMRMSDVYSPDKFKDSGRDTPIADTSEESYSNDSGDQGIVRRNNTSKV